MNTIANQAGKLIGHNTDWLGAVEALEEKTNLKDKRVLLLGAGGAARAVAFGLRTRACQVYVFNRSSHKGADLAREFGAKLLCVDQLEDVRAEIVVNATSVGMFPRCEESPVSKGLLNEGMIVMDMVYCPQRTRLLRDAEKRGCRTIDGIEMLVHQGAAQLQIWTGKKLEIGEIREDLRKALI